MYLHIGNGFVADENDLIGIFDLDNLTSSEGGSSFLQSAEKEGTIENIGDEFDLPKSIIVTKRKDDVRVILSPITTLTLWKRSRDAGGGLL